MLGKLIKYDFKALNRFLLIIHGFLLISVVLGRIFLTGRIDFDSIELNQTLLAVSFTLYFLIFTAASFGTYIIIAIRFYKNLYSDEGYLSHTLPVTRGQHMLSKIITGSIWSVIDIALIVLSGYILIATPYVTHSFQENKAAFLNELGFTTTDNFHQFLLYMAFISIIGAISSVITIIASIIIGQLFGSHRILGAVVSYFGISTVISAITTIIFGVSGILTDAIATADTKGMFNFYEYMMKVINISVILTVITAVVLYIISYLIFKKKLNLN